MVNLGTHTSKGENAETACINSPRAFQYDPGADARSGVRYGALAVESGEAGPKEGPLEV
jgi:hypothetical protein